MMKVRGKNFLEKIGGYYKSYEQMIYRNDPLSASETLV